MEKITIDKFPVLRFLFGSGKSRFVIKRLCLIFGAMFVVGFFISVFEGSFYVKGEACDSCAVRQICPSRHSTQNADSTLTTACRCSERVSGGGKGSVTDSCKLGKQRCFVVDSTKTEGFVGYGEDIANYFYFACFVMSFYLVWRLIGRFNMIFAGGDGGPSDEPDESQSRFIKGDSESGCLSEVGDYVKTTNLGNLKGRVYFGSLWLGVLLGWVVLAIILPDRNAHVAWNFCYCQFPWSYFFNQAKDFVVFAVFLPSILWVTIRIAFSSNRIIRSLADNDCLRIVPISPDGAGGLAPLGRLSLGLFYLVIIQFFHILPTTLVHGFKIGHQVVYVLFFTFAAFVFFYPLVAARKPMRKAKELELNRIQGLVDDAFASVLRGIQAEDSKGDTSSEGFERLAHLRQLYHDMRQMPVWPYDFSTLVRFSSIFLIPALAFVIQMIFNAESILYKPEELGKLLSWIQDIF